LGRGDVGVTSVVDTHIAASVAYLVSVSAVLRHLDVLLEKTTTPNQEG
jgi:hypothetical protein